MESAQAPPIVGAWRLVSWEAIAEDGSVEHPMGRRPEGRLVYTADGTMLALMGRSARPLHAGGDVTGSTAAESQAAMRTFIAYGGRYEFDGTMVAHRVEISLFPNWIGTRQVREVAIDEDGRRMTLLSPPLDLNGVVRCQRLVWERLKEASDTAADEVR